jgi:A/G-specific adenine glycosylase
MLQQTQVKTVLPYFERFLKRFPSITALAEAEEEEVLAAWSGLGYYRRARALHRAAKIIVNDKLGHFPATYEEWLALPGIGRYTAGAIMSIAYGKKYAILDGNVARVLARFFKIHGDPRRQAVRKVLWQKAEQILPERSVSDFNQALMELGALVCTPRNPRCLVCPIEKGCRARQEGVENALPETAPRKASVAVTLTAAVVRRGDRVLMYQRQSDELMRGLWELPGGACKLEEDPRAAVVREAGEQYGLELEPISEIARVRHSIMNRRITLHAFEARLKTRGRGGSTLGTWVRPNDIENLPVSSMTLKVLRTLDPPKGRT